MRNFAFLGMGLTFLLMQANLFRVIAWTHVPGLVPSIVLPLIVFMGVHEYSLARGAAVAFVLGYATDLIGIAPVGLYTSTFVAIFVMARAAGVRLAAQTMWMQAILGFSFTLIHSVMVLVLLAIFAKDSDKGWIARSLYPLILPHSLATAVIAPVVFRVARRIHTLTSSAPRPEAGGGRA